MIKKSTLSPETYRFSILKFFHFDEEKFNASFENVSLIVKFFSIERPPPFYTLTLFTYTSLLICRLTSVKPVPPTLEFGDNDTVLDPVKFCHISPEMGTFFCSMEIVKKKKKNLFNYFFFKINDTVLDLLSFATTPEKWELFCLVLQYGNCRGW